MTKGVGFTTARRAWDIERNGRTYRVEMEDEYFLGRRMVRVDGNVVYFGRTVLSDHSGAYQFDLPTWRSVGGKGYPNLASRAEQDARALILYRTRGWQPWQCASILGLREDAAAAGSLC